MTTMWTCQQQKFCQQAFSADKTNFDTFLSGDDGNSQFWPQNTEKPRKSFTGKGRRGGGVKGLKENSCAKTSTCTGARPFLYKCRALLGKLAPESCWLELWKDWEKEGLAYAKVKWNAPLPPPLSQMYDFLLVKTLLFVSVWTKYVPNWPLRKFNQNVIKTLPFQIFCLQRLSIYIHFKISFFLQA